MNVKFLSGCSLKFDVNKNHLFDWGISWQGSTYAFVKCFRITKQFRSKPISSFKSPCEFKDVCSSIGGKKRSSGLRSQINYLWKSRRQPTALKANPSEFRWEREHEIDFLGCSSSCSTTIGVRIVFRSVSLTARWLDARYSIAEWTESSRGDVRWRAHCAGSRLGYGTCQRPTPLIIEIEDETPSSADRVQKPEPKGPEAAPSQQSVASRVATFLTGGKFSSSSKIQVSAFTTLLLQLVSNIEWWICAAWPSQACIHDHAQNVIWLWKDGFWSHSSAGSETRHQTLPTVPQPDLSSYPDATPGSDSRQPSCLRSVDQAEEGEAECSSRSQGIIQPQGNENCHRNSAGCSRYR